MRSHLVAVEKLLKSLGCTKVDFVAGGKHIRVVFTYKGYEHFVVAPSTPRDEGNSANVLRQAVYRTLKLPRGAEGKKKRGHRQTKKAAAAHARPAFEDSRPTIHQQILEVMTPSQRSAHADRLWRRLFRLYLIDVIGWVEFRRLFIFDPNLPATAAKEAFAQWK